MTNAAYDLHTRGKRLYESGFYAEAERCYQMALELGGDHYEHIAVLKLDLASTWQMTWRFKEAAKAYYEEILEADRPGRYADVAREELDKLQKRKLQWSVPSDARPLTADDQRFLDIVPPMLANYPALFRPIHFTWVDESDKSLRRIQEIQQSYGASKEEVLQSFTGWEALGLIVGYWHLVMIKSDWQKAKESPLRGLLSHELAHAEIKDTFTRMAIYRNQFDFDPSDIRFICNERITDLLAISKGYGSDLLESRKFQARIRGSLERTSSLTTPKELERILRGRR